MSDATAHFHANLHYFVTESNAIEGIHREPTFREITAHERLLRCEPPLVKDLCEFVADCAGAPLRYRPGMNVTVGGYVPPPGGSMIRAELQDILGMAASPHSTPYGVHRAYEALHPFMDGNGRSGRVLWLWQKLHRGEDPFARSFLQGWYYESLAAIR
jgi:hypothetical protein